MTAERIRIDLDLKKKGIALKVIQVDQENEGKGLKEELQSLDDHEVALLSRQIRRVIQSKTQRYGKGFLKSNNINKMFNNSKSK